MELWRFRMINLIILGLIALKSKPLLALKRSSARSCNGQCQQWKFLGLKCSPMGPALWDKRHQNICTHHWNAITLEKESSSYREAQNNHRQHTKIGKQSSGSGWDQETTKAKPSHTPSSKKSRIVQQSLTLEESRCRQQMNNQGFASRKHLSTAQSTSHTGQRL